MEKIFIVIHNDNKEYKNNYQIQFEFRNSDYQNHNFQLHFGNRKWHLQYSQLEFELTMILKLLLLLTITI